jgi:hypothetical protein
MSNKYEVITSELGEKYIRWDDEGTIRFIPMDESNADYQAYLADEATAK